MKKGTIVGLSVLGFFVIVFFLGYGSIQWYGYNR